LNWRFAAALVAAALAVGIVAGGQVGPIRDTVDDVFGGGEQDATSQAIDVIDENYFHQVDPDQLESSSVRALVDQIKKQYHDRFSHYFSPAEFGRFKQGASFSGVGLGVNEVDRGLRVATVYKHTPAKEAGMQEGDVITAVNGRSIAGENADAVTARIRGPEGTKVTLTVVTDGEKPREVALTRRQVDIPQVIGRIEEVDGKKLGYVRLVGFFEGAHAELKQEVDKLYEQGAEGLVLDLRGNGGGLLTEAVLIGSLFVQDGVIVSTSGRTQDEETFEAVGDALPRHPMVVLINHDTASASEIVTAALEQAGIAEVAGTRSFGKGTFQQVIPLDNGGALDLTVGEYLTRDGTSINGTGITPQVMAKDIPKTKLDEGRERALQLLAAQTP
jgi:carboxyl-terminal processing protease